MISTAPARPVPRPGGVPTLDAAFGRRGVVDAISSGLRPADWDLALHSVSPLPRAFRMMVNDRAFHVAEMPLTTLAMAIEHGRPIIGLPAVLNRDFHYRSIVVGATSTITDPRELIGRRVGVRAYSQTTGVWVRGLLQDEFGIDPTDIEWVTTEGAHVAEYTDPPFVHRAAAGSTLPGLLAAGDIDAAVIMDPKLDPDAARPLFADATDRAAAAYTRTSIYPVNHVVAVDTAVLDELPDVADQLYTLLLDSKDRYRARLERDGPRDAADRHTLELRKHVLAGDFNPYGIENNRASCELLLSYAFRQGLLTHPLALDQIFHTPIS